MRYEEPKFEIISLGAEDVIVTSFEGGFQEDESINWD